MSHPLVAIRPRFPWTVAVATSNGDIIIRHLPVSLPSFTSENIIYLGRGTMFQNLQWTEDGDLLLADDHIFTFLHNKQCTFVSHHELCCARNNIVHVKVDDKDILETTCAATSVDAAMLPHVLKSRVAGMCAALSTLGLPQETISHLASLLVYTELNANRDLYGPCSF